MLNVTDTCIGHFVYEEGNGRNWDIEIRKANCLAAMVYLCKDKENKLSLGLFNFYADEKHIKNILKNGNKLCTGITHCTLNIKYKEALTILKYWSKEIEINVINK